MSMKPLASWIEDLNNRINFLNNWIDGGVPKIFWISGFFFPQAFLTGIRSGESRAGDVFTEGCAADASTFWLIGSSHKTGTEFVEGLFNVATKKTYGCAAAVDKEDELKKIGRAHV